MQLYDVTFEGVSPLMMNRYVGQEGQKDRTRAEKKLNERESGRWKEKVYWSEALRCVALPANMIESCIAAGARAFKLGKQANATLFIDGDEVPVTVDGKRITEVEQNGVLDLDGRGAVVQRKRVDRYRPIIRGTWVLSFRLAVLDTAAINEKTLITILENAGRFCGLGDFRPRFGRFNVTRVQAVAAVKSERELVTA